MHSGRCCERSTLGQKINFHIFGITDFKGANVGGGNFLTFGLFAGKTVETTTEVNIPELND